MTMRRFPPGSGLALIVVVGVLGVLAVLATAFVTMAQLERKASLQRLNAAKAYLLARSGIEDALARIDLGQDTTYLGEDWNANGLLDTGVETASQVYHPGVLDTDGCPIQYALRPSFFVGDGTGKPALLTCDGKQRGYSGKLSGDANALSNNYATQLGTEAGFYVNGGDSTAASDVGYNAVLRRILGTLADAIHHDGGAVTQADGFSLIDNRPRNGGWRGFSQIRDVALGGSQAKLDALAPYLALHAWVDKHVVQPNAVASWEDQPLFSWGDIREAHANPSFEMVGGKVVGRAPVELSWARKHRPALIALLGGLKGLYLDETTARPSFDQIIGDVPDAIGHVRSTEITLDWSQPSDDCRNTADRILTSTSPLQTWQQWNEFCDTLPMTGTSNIPQAKRDILKANFNPNSDLNKFNPNRSLWKTVDKLDLLVYSTEFSLFPIASHRVSSVGRVLGSRGNVMGFQVLTAILAAPGVIRLSTQREFLCEDLGDPDVPGDESNPRLPGVPEFVTQSRGNARTWGHRLDTTSLYPGGWANGDSSGSSLQSYPEPYVNPGGGLTIKPADYDGNLQLATVETGTPDFYGLDALPLKDQPAVLDMKMLASYTDRLDLDVAEAYPGNANAKQNQADTLQVWTTELDHGLLQGSKPNSLYPDGCYCERDRSPAYFDKNNANGYHGVMSFWVKRNYSDDAGYSRGHQFIKWSNILEPPSVYSGPDDFFDDLFTSFNQFFFVGEPRQGYPNDGGGVVAHFEIGHANSDVNMEHRFRADAKNSALLQSRHWHLVTFFWDFLSPTNGNTGEMILDEGGSRPLDGNGDSYVFHDNDPTEASDITQDDRSPTGSGPLVPHMIAFGRRGYLKEYWEVGSSVGTGADATLDEFVIYDFGGAVLSPKAPATSGTLGSPSALATARYAEGRYYKGWKYNPDRIAASPGDLPDEAACYFTPVIALPVGSVIRELDWTWYRPRELPDDYAEIALVNPAGSQYLFPAPTQSRSTQASDWTPDRQQWAVNGKPALSFRVQVLFRRVTPLGGSSPSDESKVLNTALLDSPIFDDLSIVYIPSTGPRMLSYGDTP